MHRRKIVAQTLVMPTGMRRCWLRMVRLSDYSTNVSVTRLIKRVGSASAAEVVRTGGALREGTKSGRARHPKGGDCSGGGRSAASSGSGGRSCGTLLEMARSNNEQGAGTFLDHLWGACGAVWVMTIIR